jgi:hypothetical protein
MLTFQSSNSASAGAGAQRARLSQRLDDDSPRRDCPRARAASLPRAAPFESDQRGRVLFQVMWSWRAPFFQKAGGHGPCLTRSRQAHQQALCQLISPEKSQDFRQDLSGRAPAIALQVQSSETRLHTKCSAGNLPNRLRDSRAAVGLTRDFHAGQRWLFLLHHIRLRDPADKPAR